MIDTCRLFALTIKLLDDHIDFNDKQGAVHTSYELKRIRKDLVKEVANG